MEYVETNCSWYTDRETACELLQGLKAAGLGTLLVSISPFHNEHIPFAKTKGVIAACEMTGLSVFPWVLDFYRDLDRCRDSLPHSLTEYEQLFGEGYIRSIPSRYWIHFGGRALKTFSSYMEQKSPGEIIAHQKHGCRELLDTSHFHLDLFDNYIPGLCSGLCLKRNDLGTVISADRYPLLTELFHRGIHGLYTLARTRYGYEAKRGFITKCDLCTDIRLFLTIDCGIDWPELQPSDFYYQLARER